MIKELLKYLNSPFVLIHSETWLSKSRQIDLVLFYIENISDLVLIWFFGNHKGLPGGSFHKDLETVLYLTTLKIQTRNPKSFLRSQIMIGLPKKVISSEPLRL